MFRFTEESEDLLQLIIIDTQIPTTADFARLDTLSFSYLELCYFLDRVSAYSCIHVLLFYIPYHCIVRCIAMACKNDVCIYKYGRKHK